MSLEKERYLEVQLHIIQGLALMMAGTKVMTLYNNLLIDPTSAKHSITIIEDRCLTRSY